MTPALELLEIRKRFGPTLALDGARLSVAPGEIHALLGENGAGKSTLVAIASGRMRADAGDLRRDGGPVALGSARDARKAGIALVPQHDLLVEALSVADNLALLDPRAPLVEGARSRRARALALASRLELDLGDPAARVAGLPVGLRQRIEIAGALLDDPAVLILDEPTAVLSPGETAELFRSLRERANSGRAVVLITHRLAEVFESADRLTLLSRGRTVLERRIPDTTPAEVAAVLLGASEARGEVSRGPAAAGGVETLPALEVDDLLPRGSAAPPARLSLRAGDVQVLLGIDGNGADLLAGAVAGLVPATGRIRLAGRDVGTESPSAFRAAGGRFVPGDRRREGLVLELSLEENLGLPDPPGKVAIDRRALRRNAEELLSRFGVRSSGPGSRARDLSGGNQQKVVLARELATTPRVVVAIHPTRGLDIASAADVRARLRAAAAEGAAVLVVTADPDEAVELSAPIRVAYRGALSPLLPAGVSRGELGRRMAGLAA